MQASTDIIISRPFSADMITPISAFHAIRQRHPEAVMLESLADEADTGRYSHIGFECLASVTITAQECRCSMTGTVAITADNCLQQLRDCYTRLRVPADDARIAIVGGLVGYCHYESIMFFENIPTNKDNTTPLMQFSSFRRGLTFDHQTQEMIISVRVPENTGRQEIENQIQTCYATLIRPSAANQLNTQDSDSQTLPDELTISVSDADYIEQINTAKAHIVEGDIYQVVLSRSFHTPFHGDPLDIYRALRHLNPSPYMFYLPMGNSVMVGASPEKLVSLQDGELTVNPLAGTRACGFGADELTLAMELSSDEKETAEHMMLVDLARNDVGRIAAIGSVKVKQLMHIKRFRHVMHLSSQITAEIDDKYDAFDALRIAFPAGTLSGAPKIRAMEIIHALEKNPRQLYGGAVLVFDGSNNIESCIAIRMAQIQNNMATVRTGAGVVFDSDPKAEADETRSKARSVLKAIHLAQEATHDFTH